VSLELLENDIRQGVHNVEGLNSSLGSVEGTGRAMALVLERTSLGIDGLVLEAFTHLCDEVHKARDRLGDNTDETAA